MILFKDKLINHYSKVKNEYGLKNAWSDFSVPDLEAQAYPFHGKKLLLEGGIWADEEEAIIEVPVNASYIDIWKMINENAHRVGESGFLIKEFQEAVSQDGQAVFKVILSQGI